MLTCDLWDAFQGGYREAEDEAFTGPHPQLALTDEQAGDKKLTWNMKQFKAERKYFFFFATKIAHKHLIADLQGCSDWLHLLSGWWCVLRC